MRCSTLNHVVLTIPSRIWKDSRMIISYVAAFSLIVAVTQALLSTVSAKRSRTQDLGHRQASDTPISHGTQGIRERLHQHVINRGGAMIFAYQIARLGAAVVLFGLAFAMMLFGHDCSWESIALVSTMVHYGVYLVIPTQRLITFCRATRPPWLH